MKGMLNTASNSEYKERLKSLLYQLFRLEDAYLDFGIYRILNHKRQELQQFIDHELFDLIEREMQSYGKPMSQKPADVQNAEIYNSIYQFFSRYYNAGDFSPLRRYSRGTKYTIPFNGEETFFYWVNSDQYYIKTGSYLQNFRFKVEDYQFQFVLGGIDAEKNTQRLAPRFFLLESTDEIQVDEEKKSFRFTFNYRCLTPEEQKHFGSRFVQKSINEKITEVFLSFLQKFPSFNQELLKKNSVDSEKSFLLNYLDKFTTKQMRDFFIHKNLKEFLEKELHNYCTEEIIQKSDDAQNHLSKIVVSVTSQIIGLLGQVEEFQKKLWEKKKFIINTDYLISLDRVPKPLYDVILQNQDQLAEWTNYYQIKFPEFPNSKVGGLFLQKLPHLVLDTKYFNQAFKHELLASILHVDENLTGILIKSESSHALNLLGTKYQSAVDCFYLDPPYNTGEDEFIYKDNYRHSSWLTMMQALLQYLPRLGKMDGSFFISIDDNELTRLTFLLENLFGSEALFGPIIVQVNRGGRDYLPIARTHEYLLCGTLNGSAETFQELDKEQSGTKYTDEKGQYEIRELRNRNPKFNRENRPNLFYPFYINQSASDPDGFCPVSLQSTKKHTISTVPRNQKGVDGCWRWGSLKASKNIDPERTQKSELIARQKSDGGWNIYEKYRKETTKAKSIWDEKEFRTENGTITLGQLFGHSPFDHPKPVELIEKCLKIGSSDSDLILDFFGGSGTTAHAVLRLNLDESSHRKFILCEIGDHFETILIPRIKKLGFTMDWKDGKPVDNSSERGQSIFVKYQTLEQYEDTLNNIKFKSVAVLDSSKNLTEIIKQNLFQWQTHESPACVNIDDLADPYNYHLIVSSSKGLVPRSVDVIETFNYLLGLEVVTFHEYQHQNRNYSIISGKQVDQSVLIIWRNSKDLDLAQDQIFVESELLPKYSATQIYINGQSYVKNAHPIEPIFKKLMEG